MPSKSHDDGPETSIIVIVRALLQGRSNGIVDSLVIAWLANLFGELTCGSNAICISGVLVIIVSRRADESTYSDDRKGP